MYTEQEVFDRIRDVLHSEFEVDPQAIVLDAKLADDLDIDSIDAVDLLADIKVFTGRKVDPEDFKTVVTIEDVVRIVMRMQEG